MLSHLGPDKKVSFIPHFWLVALLNVNPGKRLVLGYVGSKASLWVVDHLHFPALFHVYSSGRSNFRNVDHRSLFGR